MVFFNYALRKLNAKIVYYGPGLCGKTTNLQWVHDHFDGGSRGKMISLATEGDRTIFFDLLPLDIGTIRGMEVTLQLYTVPGQVHYNSTRQLVLRGADGVVFVADSQRTMKKSNVESLKNLQENLLLQGIEISEFPHVLQFNKRDLRDLLSIEELDDDLNIHSCPFFEATAIEGIGVQDTLEGIVKLVMRKLRDRYERAAGAGARAGIAPGAQGPAPAPAPAAPKPMAPPAPMAPSPAPPPVSPGQAIPMAPPAPVLEVPDVPASAEVPLGEQAPEEPRAPIPGTSTEPVIPGYHDARMHPEGTVPSPDIEPEPDVVAFVEPVVEDIDQDNVTTATYDNDPGIADDYVLDDPAPSEPAASSFEEQAATPEPEVDPSTGAGERVSAYSADRTVDDLLEQATGASTLRVEDPSELHDLDLQPDPQQADTFSGPADLDEPAFGDPPQETSSPFDGPAFAPSAEVKDPGPAIDPIAPPTSSTPVDDEVPLSEATTDTNILFPSEPGEELLEVEAEIEPEVPAEAGGDPFATAPEGTFEAVDRNFDEQFEDHIRAPSPFAEVPLQEPVPPPAEEEPEEELDSRFISMGDVLGDAPFEESPEAAAEVQEAPPAVEEVAPPDEISAPEPIVERAEEPLAQVSDPDEILYEAPVTQVEPIEAVDTGLVFGGDEDPFADPFEEIALDDEEAAVSVEVMQAAPPAMQPVDMHAEGNRLALRLQGTGAIAEAGQVRELDIEVPVPGTWVGNQRVTLQLRLTLVPSQEEENDIGPGGAS